jgi:hypothetical protein
MESLPSASLSKPRSSFSSEPLSKPEPPETPSPLRNTSGRTLGGWQSESYSLLLTALGMRESPLKTP